MRPGPRIALVAALVLLALPLPGSAGPLTQDPCEGTATAEGWLQLGNDVLENLLFADGSLWISDGTASRIRRFDPGKSEGTGLSGIPSPGGLAEGPDGLIYAGWSSGFATALRRSGEAKVVRFDPADPAGTLADYATGLDMANGMTFGPNDELYVSNDFGYGPVVIPRDVPSAWTDIAHIWGANGLVIDPAGETLYANITFDQRSPIERIPLASPTTHEIAAQLSFGALSLEPAVHTDPDPGAPLLGVKGLDDITRDAAGNLYPVANGTGELLRVDPSNGSACLITGGLRNPSSVRIAPEGSGFADGDAGTIDFYVTEFSGAIRTVRFAA